MPRIRIFTLFLFLVGGCDYADRTDNREQPRVAQSSVSIGECGTDVTEGGRTITYCGHLGEKAFQFFDTNLSEKTTLIFLTSASSDNHYAMAIADQINERDVELVIRDICLFGCAHFIALSADSVRVSPKSIIAFSGSSTALNYLAMRGDWQDAASYREISELEAAKEHAFYEKYGIDDRWLIEPYVRMQHECVVRDIDWSTKPNPTLYTKRRYGYWVPDREMIEENTDINLTGYWPRFEQGEDHEDLSWVIPLGRKYGMSSGLSIGGDNKFFDSMYDELLLNVPFCRRDDEL